MQSQLDYLLVYSVYLFVLRSTCDMQIHLLIFFLNLLILPLHLALLLLQFDPCICLSFPLLIAYNNVLGFHLLQQLLLLFLVLSVMVPCTVINHFSIF